MNMTFEDYLADILDLQIGLMSTEQIRLAKKSYENWMQEKPKSKAAQKREILKKLQTPVLAKILAEDQDREAMCAFNSITSEDYKQNPAKQTGYWIEYRAYVRDKYEPELKEIQRRVNKLFAKTKIEDEQKTTNISLEKAKAARKLAKIYGGKALTGSPKQKSWGEAIRNDILSSNSLTKEQKEKLLQVGGFTQTAAFWIKNKDVPAINFVAESIIAQYNELAQLEQDFINDRSNYTVDIYSHVNKIIDYIDSCDFKFRSKIERIETEIEERERLNKLGQKTIIQHSR